MAIKIFGAVIQIRPPQPWPTDLSSRTDGAGVEGAMGEDSVGTDADFWCFRRLCLCRGPQLHRGQPPEMGWNIGGGLAASPPVRGKRSIPFHFPMSREKAPTTTPKDKPFGRRLADAIRPAARPTLAP